ncbi:MAG: di-trans,poly-cis-decaprenylcistransferase [Candidatus Blackburnbacteria bacterium RIFCSPHIGHO2_01_FULL_44_64]|uniref:Isoprenyl transferase n=2 Tax=Patescibacteria group TaxID=1783273 RepID=A0A0G1MMV8_9BACT|nr:MAG: Isoprenyl transferase [Candidatus Azambacteria bacterium GW2011_GWA1_44_9]OGY08306.1 MAG: di-trans,poly-cis-decaprenylcistransferase [Candidatus Blackburnbacteria bacterium RIFCSPHIGHO2_01_FULL_44_64]OGY10383.1 MAG: di-trans,poly-cis-decaprenylcistransferase [Candidatus Blackburnbacteria bacterium RIFCSPHIGHO2_02_FULL_44_20]OGY12106.1 MAG: di-trans,poly-cis-decaprenylcistransferase [Candidatus Blackburnbacteria bacterium RIFCSPHIGHO2_12_FULL_44_25]OGY13723.1 MAG: di-trans,poly-cis-decap
MYPPELKGSINTEHISAVDQWLTEIHSRWTSVPEIRINPDTLRHLAVICDGNRRAATKRGVAPPFLAHLAGVETVLAIDRAARVWGIPTCTYWLWSTENWGREEAQINFMTQLARTYLTNQTLLEEFKKDDVRVIHIGSKVGIPPDIADALASLEEWTKQATKHTINLAINYGGREELAQAIIKIASAINNGNLEPNELIKNPSIIANYLYTAGQASPDLVIRTGVTEDELSRTNWFMPLQTGESRFKFLPEMFPELTPQALIEAINHFLSYTPRMGR